MKSDITRDTFAATKHFSRVISQQGRVTLDADSNEQTSILLHYLRTLARDLIGPYAGPVSEGGFKLIHVDEDFLVIGAGRYYVQGLLVENESNCSYTRQPYYPLPENDAFARALADKPATQYWLYLDVWERHVTALDDDSIREQALGGPDTCTRAEVAWQVKALEVEQKVRSERRAQLLKQLATKKAALEKNLGETKLPGAKVEIQKRILSLDQKIAQLRRVDELDRCAGPLKELPSSDASMGARVNPGPRIADACVTSPDSKYRGAENQLYRVEIHRGGVAGEATFKWSRDNGSVATAWLGTTGYDLAVANARGFSAGNWVELIDGAAELRGESGRLVRLTKAEAGTLSVDPEVIDSADLLRWNKDARSSRVRRWDQFETEDTVLQKDGSILIKETPAGTLDAAANWLDLEDAIQVQFAEGGEYRTGDYWLIPARVTTGNIEWPESESDTVGTVTAQVAPHGVIHHYAPLGFVTWADGKLQIESCDCRIEPLSSCQQKVRLEGQPQAAPAPKTEPVATKKGAGRASKKPQ